MRRLPRKQKGQASGPRRLDGTVLDVAAAAELLGVTEKLVRARAARGLLPWRRWGGRVLFLREELLAFMGALPGVSVQQALENVGARAVEQDL
ncbi:MAG: helix-turn-helix domain-containing protein [candidate division NC10 bacterium]|nr:helix-turn-helix domain-containing protein [candidate division NC10 bacterium]